MPIKDFFPASNAPSPPTSQYSSRLQLQLFLPKQTQIKSKKEND